MVAFVPLFVDVKVAEAKPMTPGVVIIIDDSERSGGDAQGVAQRDVLAAQEELIGAAGVGQFDLGAHVPGHTAVLDRKDEVAGRIRKPRVAIDVGGEELVAEQSVAMGAGNGKWNGAIIGLATMPLPGHQELR